LVGQDSPHLSLRELGEGIERLGLEDPGGLALFAVELGQGNVAVPPPADFLRRAVRFPPVKDLLAQTSRQDVVAEGYLAAVRKLDRAQHSRAVPAVARHVAEDVGLLDEVAVVVVDVARALRLFDAAARAIAPVAQARRPVDVAHRVHRAVLLLAPRQPRRYQATTRVVLVVRVAELRIQDGADLVVALPLIPLVPQRSARAIHPRREHRPAHRAPYQVALPMAAHAVRE